MNINQLLTQLSAELEPMKLHAMASASVAMQKKVDQVAATLEAFDWKIGEAFPYPSATGVNTPAKVGAYRKAVGDAKFARMLIRMDRELNRLAISQDAVVRLVQEAAETTSMAFAAFAAKLTSKIEEGSEGRKVESVSAWSRGGIWQESLLTVTYTDGSTARWRTQRILNHSKLGTPFYQFPTRKAK